MKAIYVAARDRGGHARLAARPISEVMHRPVVTVSAGASLDDALVRMISVGLRHLAVVDASGSCQGVLGDRVIASTWAGDYAALSHTVGSVLEKASATLESGSTVGDAAKLMRHSGVDAVVVVDAAGKPVGMVTGSDLVALLAG